MIFKSPCNIITTVSNIVSHILVAALLPAQTTWCDLVYIKSCYFILKAIPLRWCISSTLCRAIPNDQTNKLCADGCYGIQEFSIATGLLTYHNFCTCSSVFYLRCALVHVMMSWPWKQSITDRMINAIRDATLSAVEFYSIAYFHWAM